MNVAAIDIGTNTVLLLIAEVDDSGTISTVVYEQRAPRLGRGVDADRRLDRAAMERTVDVLREYAGIIAAAAPDAVVAGATSAVRDAQNRGEFLALAADRTGLRVELLSGADEALWTYRGAISGIPEITDATVVDIGGGSTEITVGDRARVRRRVSLDIGSVRLTERHFRHDPPTAEEQDAARRDVRSALDAASEFGIGGTTLVGVAGTATALAVLDRGLRRFDIAAVTNHRLTRERVQSLLRRLSGMPAAAIRELSDVMEGRADIITAGTLILDGIMERFGCGTLLVSERGVRYGLVLRTWLNSTHTGAA